MVPAGQVKKEETRAGRRKWNDRWSKQSGLALQCELGGRIRIAKRGKVNRAGGLRATTRKRRQQELLVRENQADTRHADRQVKEERDALD